MPTTVNVDVNGIASFRKSLYDEEGDVIDLSSVEVVEIDGNPVAEGPDRTPDWLTTGYATVDEETADGPLGSRRYLHLDFAIDTEHATIEKNTSYLIRATADDNFNPAQSFDFLYTNGVLDFSTLTGLTGHFAYRLQGGGNTNTLTNFGSGGNLVGDQLTAAASLYGERGAWYLGGDMVSVAAGLLPTGSGFDPWSIFLLIQCATTPVGGVNILEQEDVGNNGFRLSANYSELAVYTYADGSEQEISTAFGAWKKDVLQLIEIHKASDGTVEFLLDAASIGTLSHIAAMPAMPFEVQFGNNQFSYLTELIVISGELTAAQKTQARKALKALYPMSEHEVT